MTHPLRVAENCTTHPLHKAQNLMTHPLSAPAHPPPRPILFDQSLICAGSPSLRKQPFLLALRFVAEVVLRGMSEEKRLFSQGKGALALRKFLQVRTLVPEVSLEFLFAKERANRGSLSLVEDVNTKQRLSF